MKASPAMKAAARPQATVLSVRQVEKNTLKGFFDLALPSGMIVRGCSLHVKNGRAWVGSPGRKHVDANGAETWSNVIDFRDRASKNRFQKIALTAVAADGAFPEIAAQKASKGGETMMPASMINSAEEPDLLYHEAESRP